MTKPKRPAYEKLHFVPWIIAETVAERPYTGYECGEQIRSHSTVVETEKLRQQLMPEHAKDFADIVDKLCRNAYAKQQIWFMKCVDAKGNVGRDQLYIWVSRWLGAYLQNPKRFREQVIGKKGDGRG